MKDDLPVFSHENPSPIDDYCIDVHRNGTFFLGSNRRSSPCRPQRQILLCETKETASERAQELSSKKIQVERGALKYRILLINKYLT